MIGRCCCQQETNTAGCTLDARPGLNNAYMRICLHQPKSATVCADGMLGADSFVSLQGADWCAWVTLWDRTEGTNVLRMKKRLVLPEQSCHSAMSLSLCQYICPGSGLAFDSG